MDYPNFMAPSPQEIYDGLKMIPNNPQGKQMLSQLAQQGKQTGSIEGGIATALLNSYNKAQPAPQPPQGTVADQVIAQAQPPMDPNMLGLAMPGLEGVAQQGAQQMAGGGIVALAGGGPVREFDLGGVADLAADSPWMQGMPDVPEAPDTTAVEQDYFSAPAIPETTSRTVGKGESDKPSFEERVNKLGELYGEMPDVAAQLISEHEHRQAQRSKMNTFEAIASGLSGYLSSYGSGAHRAGAGLASMLGTMGTQRRSEDETQAALDALRVKSAMQPYEIRKDLIHQVQAAQTAHEKAQAEANLKAFELREQRKTEAMKQQFGITKEEMQGAASRDVANIHANAQVRAAMERINREGLTGGNRTSLYNSILDMAANGEIDPDEVETYYNEAIRRVGGGAVGAPAQTSSPAGQQVQLGGGKTGWLR